MECEYLKYISVSRMCPSVHFNMNQENSVDLSKSVKDVLQAAQVPQEFVTEPIIEEKITEVYVPVYEKEIVEVPQVRSDSFSVRLSSLDSIC